jgi:DNA-entry nuclease
LDYSNQQIVNVNEGKPTFTKDDLSIAHGSWQTFSDLDSSNRVGTANAMLGKDLMPTKERDPLYVQPTGWHNKQVNSDGNRIWLYNRSHIIGYQLTGENNNPKNLMTGTASLNAPGMEEYESQVAKYIKSTNHHVRYQVEPIFRGNELLARGVHMQAQSVEDNQVSFNIYIFNVQQDVTLNYNDGTSVQN